VQEPKIDFDESKSIRFRLDYDFLPKSIVPRFIVKKHEDIKNDYRWRTGVNGATHSYKVADLLGSIRVQTKRTEEEFIELLRKTLTENDTEESIAKKGR
jgi:hypothetical protein